MGTVSDLVANSWLDALCRAVAYSEAAFWCKLHLGDPGAAGTTSPAAHTTRIQATFGNAAASRAITNTVAVEWTSLSAAETITWISVWDASAAGNFLGRDDLSSSAIVAIGDTLRIPIGDLDLTIT